MKIQSHQELVTNLIRFSQAKSDPKNFAGFKAKKLETKEGFGSLIIAVLLWIILNSSLGVSVLVWKIWISDRMIHIHISDKHCTGSSGFPTVHSQSLNGFLISVACANFQICDPGAAASKESSIFSEGECAETYLVLIVDCPFYLSDNLLV